MNRRLQKMTDRALFEEFSERTHAIGALAGSSTPARKFNRAVDLIVALGDELGARGRVEVIGPLLDDPDPLVRMYTAMTIVDRDEAFWTPSALRVLEELAADRIVVGCQLPSFDARNYLKEYRKKVR